MQRRPSVEGSQSEAPLLGRLGFARKNEVAAKRFLEGAFRCKTAMSAGWISLFLKTL